MALFQPTNISPSDLYGVPFVDATKPLSIQWQVVGDALTPLVAYQIRIMLNNIASTVLYDTGKVDLGEPFYGTDENGNAKTFSANAISAATMAAAGITNSASREYKLLITQWWTATENVTQESASVFRAVSAPQIVLDGMGTQDDPVVKSSSILTITGDYVQAEGVAPIWVEWFLYQVTASGNQLLSDSGKMYNVGPIKVTYDGLSDGLYFAGCEAYIGAFANSPEDFASGYFRVSYESETFKGGVKACRMCKTDAIRVTIPKYLAFSGTAIGNAMVGDYRYPKSAEGVGEVELEDVAASVAPTSVSVTQEPAQEGSGTPSADNVRPFIPFDAVTLYGETDGTTTEYRFPLPDSGAQVNDGLITFREGTAVIGGTELTLATGDQYQVIDTTLFSGAVPAYGYDATLLPSWSTAKSDYAFIPSYDGELLPDGKWLSSMDVWTGENMPSEGAEVVYPVSNTPLYTLSGTYFSTTAKKYYSETGAKISMQYTASTNGKSLLMPGETDGAVWGSADEPLESNSNFSIAMEAILSSQYGANLMQITSTAGRVWTMAVNWQAMTFSDDGGNTLFSTEYSFTEYNTISVLITNTRYTVIINRGQPSETTFSGALAAWQTNVATLKLNGPQTARYIWLMDGSATEEEVSMFAAATPDWTSDTIMLANFENGLSAGALPEGTGIVGYVVYRRDNGSTIFQRVGTISAGNREIRDYAVSNDGNYTYYVYAIYNDGSRSIPASSEPTSPFSWDYSILLCSVDDEGRYHVQTEYKFALDVSSGAYNNNNKPAMQANFTRYPLRQPTSQNYRSGTLSAFTGKAVNNAYVDSRAMNNAIMNISTSTAYKFLKNRKGDIIRIETGDPISLSTSDKYAAQPVRMGLPWVEVASTDNVSIIAVPNSGDYWPEA